MTWRFALALMGLTFGIALVGNFVFMVHRMLGQSALGTFFSGRYHRPVEEERVFMFLDIASSTTIAKAIGPLRFHLLLDDFFHAMSAAILASEGEIYKYAGDEVIVTWPMARAVERARCVWLYFDILDAVAERRRPFEEKFGLLPRFRAGVHGGWVVVGELGDFKREIAFLGDTVNTAARIEAAAREQGHDFLVSGAVLARLRLPPDLRAVPLGTAELRGKSEKVDLFAIERAPREG